MHYTTDFYFAENVSHLAEAYAALSKTVPFELPVVDNWDEVEFSFNRLFIGPQAPIAPPFGSVYLEPEPQTMGKSTQVVRRIYEMIGCQSPWYGTLPDDHISLELDACIRILGILDTNSSAEVQDLWHFLLLEHLAKWIPPWSTRVCSTDNVHEAISTVTTILSEWLNGEISHLKSDDLVIGQ